MPTVPSTPISQEPALSPVLATDRLIGLRTPQNQADPTKRLGPVSLTDAATALRPLLNLNTNNIVGTDKRVRFQTAAQLAAAPDGGDCLDGLSPATLVLGGLAWVEFHPLGYGTTLRLLYDGAPRTPAGSGLIAFRTGDAVAGDTVPVRWAVASGPQSGVAAYPQKPIGYVFAVGELVRAYVSDVPSEQFFSAKAATALPAPTISTGDANWAPVSASSLPAAVAPLYNGPGFATNGPMTQAATTAAMAYAFIGDGTGRNVTATGFGFTPTPPSDGIDNFYAAAFPNNTYGTGHINNRFGYLAIGNKYGNGMQHCVFGANLKNGTFGINLISCRVGDNCQGIIIGDNCQRVEVYNSQALTIPANTVDAVYRNNALVVAAPLYATTGPATNGPMTQAATTAALFFDFTNEPFSNGAGPFPLIARSSNIITGSAGATITYNLPAAAAATYLGFRLQAAPAENAPLNMVFAGGTLDNLTTLTVQPGDWRIIAKAAGGAAWYTVWKGQAASTPAFTAITANQYGTHPAFSTQDSLNGYLLGRANYVA